MDAKENGVDDDVRRDGCNYEVLSASETKHGYRLSSALTNLHQAEIFNVLPPGGTILGAFPLGQIVGWSTILLASDD